MAENQNFFIREGTVSDAGPICRLNEEEMGYSFPLEDTRRKMRQLLESGSDKIYVAVADDRVVGYVHACDYNLLYAPSMKNIMGIAVLEAYKRRGIGKALLEEVEVWARKTGCSGVRLVSGATRTGAHAFYRQCGYSGNKMQLNLKKMF